MKFFKKDIINEKKLKNTFYNIKKDILLLKKEIEENKKEFKQIKEILTSLNEKIINLPFKDEKEEELNKFNKVSIGNKGVYSFIHSFNSYSFTRHSDIQKFISTLTKQEFFVFLTLYQLSDERPLVSYYHLSKKLFLSEGCIRTYIASLLKKKAPIIKEKINNRQISLKIDPEFKNLNLKNQLVDFYYNNDPSQTKLSNNF